jgi:hypothetical protein
VFEGETTRATGSDDHAEDQCEHHREAAEHPPSRGAGDGSATPAHATNRSWESRVGVWISGGAHAPAAPLHGDTRVTGVPRTSRIMPANCNARRRRAIATATRRLSAAYDGSRFCWI